MATSSIFENLLTLGILLAFAMIVYLKVTKQTFFEFIKKMREAASDAPVQVINKVQGGFESIR